MGRDVITRRGYATTKQVACPHCGHVTIYPVKQAGTVRCGKCFTPHRLQKR